MEQILEVRELSHTYSAGTPFEKRAISNINLTIAAGETLGVVGRTGSGKSTLITHLNGLLLPTAGAVYFRGEDANRNKVARRALRFGVGLVFQYPEYQLFAETVLDDIAFGPRNMGLDEEAVLARVQRLATLVGLQEGHLARSPFLLSGGEKRRVAIAGVLAMEPEVLILDEPTAGLDPKGRAEILAVIKAYQARSGAAVVFVSHSMEEVAALATRIVVMQDGSIVGEGSPREIFMQADLLAQAALAPPEVVQIANGLRERGISLGADLLTVSDLVYALVAWKEGRGC